MKIRKIGIIGLGLIGGSLARTIRLHIKDVLLYGMDINPESLKLALDMEAIDAPLEEDGIGEMDMILVALYPKTIVTWIKEHETAFKDGALVIDCGGIKEEIVSELFPLAKGKRWHFIGGHPMAGREISGFRASRDDLFDKASMILIPSADEDPEVVDVARHFFSDIGFRRIQITTADVHDEMIAYTSQLAHVCSSAYVKSRLASKHRGFSAGSFADMTRVAKINEDMWTELFFLNQKNLLPEVEGLIERLCAYRDALRDDDHVRMRELLLEGRLIKESLEET